MNAQKPATKNELYIKLRENFGDIHLVERCREKYKSLKQTGSVQDFANKLKHTVLFLDLCVQDPTPIPEWSSIGYQGQNGRISWGHQIS